MSIITIEEEHAKDEIGRTLLMRIVKANISNRVKIFLTFVSMSAQ